VKSFLSAAAGAQLSYPGKGSTRDPDARPPAGYDRDESVAVIGSGAADFAAARTALQNWQMFPAPWTSVQPAGAPVTAGTSVALLIRVLGLWWINASRVIYVVDEPRRWGFAYGTLPDHVERGEELFLIELGADEQVRYTIRAYSRPRHPLVRFGYLYARWLQRRFRHESTAALQRAVSAAR
jgi:uncharacterized protein (UPF0548 family)